MNADQKSHVDSLPFFGVLMGATDATNAQPQAAGMRDMIANESQDAYAQGEKDFLGNMVKSSEGLKSATAWAIASDKGVVARAMYEDMVTDLRPDLKKIKAPPFISSCSTNPQSSRLNWTCF